jgi:hypothetical protein
MPPSRPRFSICGFAAFCACILLNLYGIATLSARAAEALFALTRNAHETYSDNVCAEELGEGYRVADWRDIVDQYRQTGSLDGFFAQTGLKYGSAAQVTLGGEQHWRGDHRRAKRLFFIERHDGNKPEYFLAHEGINQYQLSLGSWTGARPVLCVQGAQLASQPKTQAYRKPTTSVPFGMIRRSFSQASEYDAITNKVCIDEFGPGHLIADWVDVEAYFKKTGSLEAFLTHTGLERAFVTSWGLSSVKSATGERIVFLTTEYLGAGERARLSGKGDSATLYLYSWPKDMDKGGGSLNALCTVPAHSVRSSLPFALTRNIYSAFSDSTCVSEFGKGFRIADWKDVVDYYMKTDRSLGTFYLMTDMDRYDTAWVTRDGKPYHSSGAYHIIRFGNDPKGDYAHSIHDGINQFAGFGRELGLMSDWNPRPVLCARAPMNRKPISVSIEKPR